MDLEKALEVAKAIVYEEGRYLRKKFEEGIVEVKVKEDKTWVTEMDVKVEKEVKEKLTSIYPEVGFWGEELGEENKSEWRWVLDPIDGTTNFSLHVPFFNISLALERRGRPVLGVVYNPILDEMFYALAGKGSFLNGKRLSASGKRNAFGLCYSKPYHLSNALKIIDIFEGERIGIIRKWGSASLELSYVALGSFDGFIGLGLKLGDFKAAQVVLEEAGGVVFEAKGEKDPIIIAGKNEEVVENLTEILRRVGIKL